MTSPTTTVVGFPLGVAPRRPGSSQVPSRGGILRVRPACWLSHHTPTHRCNSYIDDIVDNDEIPGLTPIAVNSTINDSTGLLDNRSNDTRVVTACFAKAVHVYIAEGDGLDAIQLVKSVA